MDIYCKKHTGHKTILWCNVWSLFFKLGS